MQDDEMVGALGAAMEVSLYLYLSTITSAGGYPLMRLSLSLRVHILPRDVERRRC